MNTNKNKVVIKVRDLAALTLIPLSLWSCSLTPVNRDLSKAAPLPANPSWLAETKEKAKDVVDFIGNADLFPAGLLRDYFPSKSEKFAQKSKYDKALKGKLSGHGAEFEKAAEQYKIPVSLLIAICLHEVGPSGDSKMIREYNNVAGNLVKDKKTGKWSSRKFSSVSESIFYTARNLRVNYFDKGLTTIPKIKAKYAPSNAANDPKKINRSWSSAVSKYKSQLDSI